MTLTRWANEIIRALDVHDAVISPGSRSTPFAIAALRAPIRCHVVIDERSAAFFALGIARATGRAPLLICTSGTAPAHYFPAIIEASEAMLPLIVLTADRPFALQHCGAPQTIDQTRLYGDHVRFSADLGEPSDQLAALRRTCTRAANEAKRGPVHLNARAHKPLEPTATEPMTAELPRVLAPRSVPDVGPVIAAIARAERPAIVAGPLPIDIGRDAILELARRGGLALFAESTSQLRHVPRPGIACADAFDRWIERAETTPDLVIELGATPTSAAYARWVERARPERYVIGRFRDPSASATAIVLGDVDEAIAAMRLPARSNDTFARAIAREEARVWAAVEAETTSTLEEGHATRLLLAAMPRDALLMLGNSLPIRHADRFCPGNGHLRVLSQRGVNGIDGNIAGVCGAAIADGGPAALLLGDVAFAHDIGSLALTTNVRSPLAIVVLDNGGGRIFESLPVGRAGLDTRELAAFFTPPHIDFAHAAAAFGVAYHEATEPSAFRAAITRALDHRGPTIIRAVVPPHGAAAVDARIAARLAGAA
jgi:2-succinyl-5-enolpyruvyl-6-hydroxy-3-cyclohexene-1-carboxylate synthase